MNEIMSFSTFSLPVSPAIKVIDKGMMDMKSQRFYLLNFPKKWGYDGSKVENLDSGNDQLIRKAEQLAAEIE